MEKWILVLGVFFTTHDELHAKGPHSTESNCWKLGAMISTSMQHEFIYHCMTERDFRLHYPDLLLDEDS